MENEIWKELPPEVAEKLAELPEEQRLRIIGAYTTLKRVSLNPAEYMLALLAESLQAGGKQQSYEESLELRIEKTRLEMEKMRLGLEFQLQQLKYEFLMKLEKLSQKPVARVIALNVRQYTCPSCNKVFYAETLANYIACAKCGTLLVVESPKKKVSES